MITVDVINAITFSSFAGGPITTDHENMVKAYAASPSMLGRGHSLLEPKGPVWVRLLQLFGFYISHRHYGRASTHLIITRSWQWVVQTAHA